MRKILTFLFAALMSVGMWAAPIVVNGVQIDGLYYNLNNGTKTAEVIKYQSGNEYTGDIIIPESVEYYSVTYTVTSIGYEAFDECSGLTSVTIGNSVTSIGNSAFYGCSGLTSVTIGNSVTSIGEGAFAGCSGLTSITIPNSVTSIGDDAFSRCSNLTSVTIGNSVNSIGEMAFAGCSGLTSMVVASGNTKYDSRDNCNAIIETSSNTLIAGFPNTIIPNSVTSIGDYAFAGCGLTSITIPNSVEYIGESAFQECSGLTSITIPNSVISIGDYAFMSCEGLTSVTIGNSVASIGMAAFAMCSSLASIEIPNSVISIGDWAFAYCSGLASVTINATTPPTLGSAAFESTAEGLKIYVPAGSVDTYKTAWADYADQIEAIPGGGGSTPTDEQVPTNADPENPSYYYSTFFHSTQNYKLTNDGTTAFIADLSGNDLILTEIAKGSQVIPANTAVIFRKAGSAEPVALTPTEENGVSVNPDENDLEGVDAITAVTSIDGLTRDNCYVLSGQQSVGFYLINSDNLKAHKAYVKYVSTPGQNNAPKKMRFVFNTTTGVESAQPSVISGQKLIENGQLIIIKNGVRYNAQGQIVK